MNEFYSVYLKNGEVHYFKNKEVARKFLWQSYLNFMTGDETERDIENARYNFENFDLISEAGILYVEHFED